MLLKLLIPFIVILTLQVPGILVNSNNCNILTSCSVCLKNKTFVMEVLSEDLKIQVSEIPNKKVRDDYTHTPGIGWYKFHNLAKTWNEARKVCIEESAHLAILNSQQELEMLHKLLKEQVKSIIDANDTRYAWLGVHSLFNKNDWVTVLGDPLSSVEFVGWSKEKSCNYIAPSPKDLRCARLDSNCGTMLDGDCKLSRAFFCEIPQVCS